MIFIKNSDLGQININIYTAFKESSSFKTNYTFVCLKIIFKIKIK